MTISAHTIGGCGCLAFSPGSKLFQTFWKRECVSQEHLAKTTRVSGVRFINLIEYMNVVSDNANCVRPINKGCRHGQFFGQLLNAFIQFKRRRFDIVCWPLKSHGALNGGPELDGCGCPSLLFEQFQAISKRPKNRIWKRLRNLVLWHVRKDVAKKKAVILHQVSLWKLRKKRLILVRWKDGHRQMPIRTGLQTHDYECKAMTAAEDCFAFSWIVRSLNWRVRINDFENSPRLQASRTGGGNGQH